MPKSAQRLIEWRRRNDFTQSYAAQLLGFPQPTLARWERGMVARADKIVIIERVTKGFVKLKHWSQA